MAAVVPHTFVVVLCMGLVIFFSTDVPPPLAVHRLRRIGAIRVFTHCLSLMIPPLFFAAVDYICLHMKAASDRNDEFAVVVSPRDPVILCCCVSFSHVVSMIRSHIVSLILF
ncbi:hypothetical protein, unlikely [Trypanosoma brucei gambiense DAL972]|uniref:Uncharacterized protein n=1 Tax=Trypanosoma brucei gambiense (strain MHOM/CI/86/DAL972) TaxID=679716 RepID=C9ZTN5_TRYB9|nr:hypothetical protein, unlikely [Trypanosoma brucei gambiense DAL972]CBH12770.1 hypothetical protein, unlikely [Trypanosoma brucei gambiense DAL972]|eukprot:XP_011775050.1 hypothetical protein, unlikely [Trypanosoma brucei gambiense DAL972]